MKILMLAPNPFYVDRGFSIRIYNQVTGLQKLGHQVQVVSYHAGIDLPGIRTVRIPDVPGYGSEALGARISRLYLDVFLLVASFIAAFRFRPDVIHGHLHEGAAIGAVLGAFFRVPVLLDAQGGLAAELSDRGTVRNRAVLGLVKYIEGLIYRLSDRIIFSSPGVKKLLVEDFGVPEGKVRQIGDSVDAGAFALEPASDRAKFGLGPGDKVMVYVGTLHKYYGTDCLLEAIALVKGRVAGARFLICGGPDAEKYRNRARELGIDGMTVFVGRTSYFEMPRYLGLADAAVAPKLSGSEGNQKILAYMAFGLPVVCFDTPVNRQMLGDFGVYAELTGPAALAEKIAETLGKTSGSEEMRIRMRKWVRENFSVESSAAELASVYRGMLGSRREV